jgi:hypothetical protein
MTARQLAIQLKIEERIKTTAEREQYAKVSYITSAVRSNSSFDCDRNTIGADSKRSGSKSGGRRHPGTVPVPRTVLYRRFASFLTADIVLSYVIAFRG